MKRLLVCVTTAAAGLALNAASAQAASFTLTQGVEYIAVYDTTHAQGTGSCVGAGCEATVSYLLSGSTLIIEVENTSSDTIDGQNVLTALYFETDPDLTGVTFGSFTGGMSTWEGGFNKGSFEINLDSSNGVNDGLDDGDSGSVTVSFSNILSSLTITDSQVHIQSIVGNGNSDKLTCCEGEGEEGEGEEGEGEEGSVPEPASLLLFGAALSAAGLRMRRVRA